MAWVGWADGDDLRDFATFGPSETVDGLMDEAYADLRKGDLSDGRWHRGILIAGEVEPYPVEIDARLALDEIQELFLCEVPWSDYLFDRVEYVAVANLNDRLNEVLLSWMEENGIARPEWVPRVEEYDLGEWEPSC